MCNRFRGIKDWSEIPRVLAQKRLNFDYNPNVAPTEQVPAFLAERGKPLETKMARFGILFPPREGKKRPPLLNARTDSLRRGSFKTMLANRHCVIPAQGFYEWREEEGKKQPYYFARKDGKPIMFAGVWDYSELGGDTVPSFASSLMSRTNWSRPITTGCRSCSKIRRSGLIRKQRSMMRCHSARMSLRCGPSTAR
jgi:putative SOS response-associated peptidase YedK